jgi:hypothetical protein
MWRLKDGDLGFIERSRPAGTRQAATIVSLGNHRIVAEEWKISRGGRYYALNPVAQHREHHLVQVQGWVELRLARAWLSSAAD